MLISGEAGIGKTRIVSELIKNAETKGVRILQGWCLAESLEPLMPFREIMKGANLHHLLSGAPPPKVVSCYIINRAGMLIAKAERKETGLDPDIFAGMLQAVGNFVKDSMGQLGDGEGDSLNTLGFGDRRILITTRGNISFACVIQGAESEFLFDDMANTLEELKGRLDGWTGNVSDMGDVEEKLAWFTTSGKYDGKFLVDDPKIKQENLFDNVLLGIQRSAFDSPLVLFLDDLQWADATSLNLLHYMARNIRQNKVLILGTYRPEDIIQSDDGKPHHLMTTMQNMNREDLLEKVDLNRLDHAHTETLINNALGSSTLGDDIIERIYGESGGTPLYTLEVMKLLVGCGHIAQKDGAWNAVGDIKEMDIPSKVYDVIKRRIDRLDRGQRQIMDCASVIGEEFQSGVVGKVMDLNKFRLLEDLSDIEKTHQLIHYLMERYRFDHAKIRDVLYNGIGEELRREYHKMIGSTLSEIHGENMDEVLGEVAFHYHEARDTRAIEYLVKAGDKARDCYENEEAIYLYLRAFETIDGPDKWKLLEEIGDIKVLTGDYEDANTAFGKTIDAIQDGEDKARVHRKIGETLEKMGDFETALKPLGKAMELIGDEMSTERGRIKVAEGYAYYRSGNYEKAMPLFLEGLEIFKMNEGNDVDLAHGLRAVGNIHYSKGNIDGALESYEKSLYVTERIDDLKGTATNLANIGVMNHIRGDMEKAFDFYNKGLAIREKIGNKSGIADSLNNLGMLLAGRGELGKALDCYKRCLAIEESIGNKSGIADSLNNIGTMHHNMGELDAMLECHERSLEIRMEIGDQLGIGMSYDNIGSVHLEKGEAEKAVEHYKKALDIYLEVGAKLPAFYAYRGLTEAYLELGDIDNAHEAVKKGLAIAVEMSAMGEEGIGQRLLGMVHGKAKEWEKAIEAFDKAGAILEEAGAVDEIARLKYEEGVLWKEKGEPEKAREYFEKALKMNEDMGMKLWEGKCRKALEDLE